MTRLLPVLLLLLSGTAHAASVLRVPADYARITDALAAAQVDDTVRVAPGTYSAATNGEAFPLTLGTWGVVLEGAGMGLSVLDAAQGSSVVICTAVGVRVTGFTITGGRAQNGGGVLVQSNDAQVDHNLILGCAAITRGAAIFASNGSLPWIHHNVVWQSMDAQPGSAGDPHGIQITNSNALVEFNTVGRGDSNGLIVEGTAEPIVRGNIFFENGSAALNRGRGICALGGAGTVIRNNVFFGNHIAAILVRTISATLDLTAQQANDADAGDAILENLDADPLLADPDALDAHLTWGSPAIDAGWLGSALDPDGTRADAGAFAFDHRLVGVDPPAGARTALSAAPNPFVGRTTLSLTSSVGGTVEIVDARGRLVRRLHAAGRVTVAWDGRDDRGARSVPGVYFARVGAVISRPLVLLR
jgi:YD repeat-containing protein